MAGNSWQLPQGCYQVLRCWERQTASQNNFCDMGEPANGLAGVYQTCGFGRWEWRQNMVVLPGSLDYRDLRLRYKMILNTMFVANADPATTYLPIMGCEEAVARIIDRLYAARQGGTVYEMRKAEADSAIWDLLNEEVQGKQGQNYRTLAYGSEMPPVSERRSVAHRARSAHNRNERLRRPLPNGKSTFCRPVSFRRN